MKTVVVCSKRGFPEWVRKTKATGEPWAYISIEGTSDLVRAGLISDNTHYLPEGPDTLNLRFDDISEETPIKGTPYRATPISEDQAREIVEFGRTHQGYNLLIHCYAGKSRSVAIGMGLIDVFPEVWEVSRESNPLLTPNAEVLRLIHKYGLYM